MSSVNWTEGLRVAVGSHPRGIADASPETQGFWEGVERRELMIKYCTDCKLYFHPRRIVCHDCGTAALEWRRASGRGEVYSYSEIHRSPRPAFKDSIPYTVGIVKIEEGVYMFTRFFKMDSQGLDIGTRVNLDFRLLEEGDVLPVWNVEA